MNIINGISICTLFLAYFIKLFGIAYEKTFNVHENNFCHFFLQLYIKTYT